MIPFLSTIAGHYIIVLFLFLNLAISFWAYRQSKANSFEDYALASRSLPTGVLVMTLLGTFLSTGHFAFPGWVAKYGLLLFIPVCVVICVCWIIGTFLAPYLTYFQNMITTGDLMGLFYGRFAQIVTGAFGGIFSVVIISGQLKAIGHISAHFLEIDPLIAIVCFGGFIVLYSIWGGMRAVSYTDVLQIVITMLMALVVVNVAMQKVGGIHMLFKKVPSSHTAFFSHLDFFVYLRYVCFSWIIPIDLLSPPIVQRMLVSDKRQVRKMWYIGSFFLLLIFGMLMCITFSSFSMGVEVDVNNTKAITTLFLTMVNKLLTEKWLLHFVCISMLSVAISTLDSYFHTLGISMVQDLIVPLRSFLGLAPLSTKRKTLFSQYSIFLLGSLAILVSYLSGASLEFIAMFKFAKFFSPMVILPLIIGIVGIKTDKTSWLSFCGAYLIAMGILFPTQVFYNGKGGLHATAYFNDCLILASLLATITYFITHIHHNDGIVTLKRSELTIAERLWLPNWSGFIKKMTNWVKAPLHLPTLASRKVVNNPTHSLSFSMVIFALYTFSSVVTGGGNDLGLANFMAGIHVVGITLCVGLMLEGIWPTRFKPYFALYWFFTLFYCLAFGSTLAFLRAHGDTMAVIKWVANFILLFALVDSMSFITLSCLGTSVAMTSWYGVFGSLPADLLESIGLPGIYLLFILLVVAVLFKCSKEKGLKERLYLKSAFSHAMTHESTQPLSEISILSTLQQRVVDELSPMQNAQGEKGFWVPASKQDMLQKGSQQIGKAVQEIKHEFGRFNKLIEDEISTLERKKVSMRSLIEAIVPTLPKKHTNRIKVEVECPKDFEVSVVRPLFSNVFTNLLKNAYLHGNASQMRIHIDGSKRKLSVHDNGRGIKAEALPRIFELHFTTGGQASNGVGLALVKSIVQASGGKISCHSRHGDKDSFTEFVMQFLEV